MARHGKNQKEYLAAEMLLKGSGLNMLDAASLAVELLSLCGGSRSMRRARKAIFLGAEELRKGERTVSFSAAVEEMLKAKRNLRPTTLRDIRYFTGALMRRCPELKGFPVRKLTPEHCAHFLEAAFTSHRQRYKGRAVMSGVLSFSLRRGWCGENPVARVDSPSFRERTIAILAPEEIGSLRTVVEAPEFRDCAPAVWVMLYAGIRPGEVVRLHWRDVDLEERVISVRSRTSKTGGIRHVTIHAVLWRLLAGYGAGGPVELLCPPNWPVRWRLLRKKAGWGLHNRFGEWSADALRHTYASYHAKWFRDFSLLQLEMGHRSSSLLRERYLNMEGVSRDRARLFWEAPEHGWNNKTGIAGTDFL